MELVQVKNQLNDLIIDVRTGEYWKNVLARNQPGIIPYFRDGVFNIPCYGLDPN
jgi:hypothetical protein